MIQLVGGKWFVFAINNDLVMLGGPFNDDSPGRTARDACLARYTGVDDPIVRN